MISVIYKESAETLTRLLDSHIKSIENFAGYGVTLPIHEHHRQMVELLRVQATILLNMLEFIKEDSINYDHNVKTDIDKLL